MDLTEYAARFGLDIMTRVDDLAPRELTPRVRYIVHARELVLEAHQPARLSWKVPRRSHNTTALVSAPEIPNVDHVGAGLVCLAVQRTRLIGHVK